MKRFRLVITVFLTLVMLIGVAFGSYYFIIRDTTLTTTLDNGLIVESDLKTGDILDIQLTTDFLKDVFELERNQVNVRMLDALRTSLDQEIYERMQEMELIELDEVFLTTEGMYSTHALLVDAASGRVVLDKGGDEVIYPASVTKVMTALIALENLVDLNEAIFLDPEIFPELYQQNAARAGFLAGTWVPAIDLLYGMMLPSGAEATLGIARGVAGSEEGFVQLMNEKAVEIGMTQTRFMNPIGLHHPDHYTTASDMVKLLRYALENQAFRELFTATTYTTTTGMTFGSTLFANMPRTTVNHGEIIGGRTGFTFEAGRCLMSLAVINGREYILFTAGAENTPDNTVRHILDALYLFDQLEW